MSALSKLCHNNGFIVSGSDEKQSQITEELKNLGIKVFIGHNAQNVVDKDLIVYTIAVGKENPEVKLAKHLGKLVMERSDLLEMICKQYKNVIAVSGTHGKTSCSAMIGNIFLRANKNPTIHLGGESENFGGNLKIGGNEFFITEACEYEKHLLKIPHNVGVILNIEYDHPDTYHSINELHETFNIFAHQSKDCTIINESNLIFIDKQKCEKVMTFSSNCFGNFSAKNIRQYKTGKITYECYKNNEFYAKICLNLYGKFNVMNSLASIAVADFYKISKYNIVLGLKTFKPVKRRFQFVGKINDNICIMDYAHHPTEIYSVLKTATEIFGNNVIAVFQPHTYSRTKKLFSEFLKSFDESKKIYILPTYSARENYMKNSSAKYLCKALKMSGKECRYFKSFSSVKKVLQKEKKSTILIIGAGDIEKLGMNIQNDYLSKKTDKAF